MIDFKEKKSYGINDLTEIVRLLRGEGGCPWDRVQTH
ncbi:MAG: nucleoside triphosphate pyrophosphohydrolase, partial [Oscillospiraceae bacterium]